MAGDYNVIPTDLDAYKPERWVDDALFLSRVTRGLSKAAWPKAGPMRCESCIPRNRSTRFWDYFRNAYARNAGIRIDHFLLNEAAAKQLKKAGVDREVRGWEKTSDHAPTWITLKTKTKQRAKPKRASEKT